MMYKITNNYTPNYLREKLAPSARPRTTDPLTLQEYRCRTDRFMSSFFPDATRFWNAMITHFSEMPTINALKSHLNTLFRPCGQSIFDIDDPLGTKYIFQLRLGLSPLRYHKNNHNFEDTSSNICLCETEIEENQHFLLRCPHYTILRATLVAKVIGILTRNNLDQFRNSERVYLYGHHSLSVNDNRNIMLATIEFVKNSNRFS